MMPESRLSVQYWTNRLSDQHFVNDFGIALARSDLALARSRPEGVHLADLCFHAQQATEKAIKALLVARGIEFPYVHDLVFLLSLLGDAGHATPEPIKLVRELTRYATATRYPGLGDRVSERQYADAIRIAEAVLH